MYEKYAEYAKHTAARELTNQFTEEFKALSSNILQRTSSINGISKTIPEAFVDFISYSSGGSTPNINQKDYARIMHLCKWLRERDIFYPGEIEAETVVLYLYEMSCSIPNSELFGRICAVRDLLDFWFVYGYMTSEVAIGTPENTCLVPVLVRDTRGAQPDIIVFV